MKYLSLLFLVFILSCETREIVEVEDNLQVSHSEKPVDQVVQELIEEMEKNGLKISSVINHSEAAEEVALELKPNTLIIFGKPTIGTQLIECDPRMGIELPLKILVWEERDGSTQVGFWRMGRYVEYYELDSCEEVLEKTNMKVMAIIDNVIEG